MALTRVDFPVPRAPVSSTLLPFFPAAKTAVLSGGLFFAPRSPKGPYRRNGENRKYRQGGRLHQGERRQIQKKDRIHSFRSGTKRLLPLRPGPWPIRGPAKGQFPLYGHGVSWARNELGAGTGKGHTGPGKDRARESIGHAGGPF